MNIQCFCNFCMISKSKIIIKSYRMHRIISLLKFFNNGFTYCFTSPIAKLVKTSMQSSSICHN